MSLQQLRNAFVPFQPDPEGPDSAALAYAASFAAAAKAHLTVRAYGVRTTAPYTVAPEMVGSLIESINDKRETELKAAAEATKKKLDGSGLDVDFQSRFELHDQTITGIGLMGRLNDISIVDAPLDYFAMGRAVVEELLFHTGRPAILVPKNAPAFKASRILVAWDGSARAARALNDAMPLLRAADKVDIVSVHKEKDLSKLPPGTQVAPFLARHGVNVEVVGLDVIGDAGKTLLSHAQIAAADMIVMGAFAHSRLRQFVFGGVTETMLLNADIPVLMSH